MAKKLKKQVAIEKVESIVASKVTSRAGRLSSVDVPLFTKAINAFKTGNRRLLYDLYDNLDCDPFFESVISRVVNSVKNANLIFRIDGKNVEAIDDLIDSEQFEYFLEEIVKSLIYGKSVIECFFVPQFHCYSVPRKNIVITNYDKPLTQRSKFIAFKEGDRDGYDYTKDEHFLECGRDNSMGAAYRAILAAIYRRNNLGDWAQNVEQYGQPHQVYKYHSHDTHTRDELKRTTSDQGGSKTSIIPFESEFELVPSGATGTHETYSGFNNAMKEEILIALLNNIMTTLSGNSEAQARIHQETEEEVYRAVRRYTQRILNSWLMPLLVKRGYKVTGGWFSFPDAGESIDTPTLVDMALKMREAGLPVDEDYIFEVSGVAKDENAAQAPTVKKEEEKLKEEKEQEDPETKEQEKEKKSDKEQKLSDDRFFLLKLWDKATSVFLSAPTKWSGAYRNLSEKWTRFTKGTLKLSDDYAINIDKLVEEAFKEVYGSRGEEFINKKLFDITNNALQEGIDTSLSRDVVDEEFAQQMKENAAVFSAFKNHQQTREIAALLYDEEGNLVPYHKFRKEALRISEKYNEHWLRTEYNTAVKRARQAANLKRYEKTKHLYPNLEYMATSSSVPRDSHEAFVGTILPIDHEVWDWLMPPSDFNCNHSVRPTDKVPTKAPMKPSDWNNIFLGNPTKTAEFINTKETPYYKNTDEKLRKDVEEQARKWQQELTDSQDIYEGKNGGYVVIVPQQGQEAKKNKITYKLMADYGHKHKLLTPINTPNVKNPDAFNLITGLYSDAKHPTTDIGKNAIQNSISAANKQRVGEVIIRLEKEYPSKDLHDGFKAAMQKGRVDHLVTVILLRKDRKPLFLDVQKMVARFARK